MYICTMYDFKSTLLFSVQCTLYYIVNSTLYNVKSTSYIICKHYFHRALARRSTLLTISKIPTLRYVFGRRTVSDTPVDLPKNNFIKVGLIFV